MEDPKYELVSKNYKIINKSFICHLSFVIGSGTFGKVLYGSHISNHNEYAIKFEKSSVKSSVIDIEYDIYTLLGSNEGIPKIHWKGEYKSYKLLIMELLGPSLDKFFVACNKKFTPLTSALLGEQMIKRVHYVHSKGFVHRDIKPNNFMLGKFSKNFDYLNDKIVYIIDFGLSKEYVDFETGKHIPFKDGRRFIGTPRYASIATHLGYKQGRRDDIESIAYILIYFILGELPWQGIKAKSKAEKKEKIRDMKMVFNFESYTTLPKQLITLLNYSKKLEYEEKPDYNYIYKLLNEVIINNSKDGFDEIDFHKHIWEWNTSFLSVLNKNYLTKYKSEKEKYERLYSGYPIGEFDDFLKKLNMTVNSYSNVNIPTTSSTTSNTNPNTVKSYAMKDDEAFEDREIDKRFEEIRLNKKK